MLAPIVFVSIALERTSCVVSVRNMSRYDLCGCWKEIGFWFPVIVKRKYYDSVLSSSLQLSDLQLSSTRLSSFTPHPYFLYAVFLVRQCMIQ
jgi:hypothetical protein